eukprot:305555_1
MQHNLHVNQKESTFNESITLQTAFTSKTVKEEFDELMQQAFNLVNDVKELGNELKLFKENEYEKTKDFLNECFIFDEESKRILAQCTEKNPLQLHVDMHVVRGELHQCFDPNTFKKTFNGFTKAFDFEQSASSFIVTLFDG